MKNLKALLAGLAVVTMATQAFAHVDIRCHHEKMQDGPEYILHFKGSEGSDLKYIEKTAGYCHGSCASTKFTNVATLVPNNNSDYQGEWPLKTFAGRLKGNKRVVTIDIIDSLECAGGCSKPMFEGTITETSTANTKLTVIPVKCEQEDDGRDLEVTESAE